MMEEGSAHGRLNADSKLAYAPGAVMNNRQLNMRQKTEIRMVAVAMLFWSSSCMRAWENGSMGDKYTRVTCDM
jgi:hypothetical protein